MCRRRCDPQPKVNAYASAPGLRERDLQRPFADRAGLADETVQPPFPEQAGALLVDVHAVRRAGRPAVEHPERDRLRLWPGD
jgi:hypothetical protein